MINLQFFGDKKDGIKIGDVVTSEYLENKGIIKSESFGILYTTSYSLYKSEWDKTERDFNNVKMYDDTNIEGYEDTSNVFDIVAKIENPISQVSNDSLMVATGRMFRVRKFDPVVAGTFNFDFELAGTDKAIMIKSIEVDGYVIGLNTTDIELIFRSNYVGTSRTTELIPDNSNEIVNRQPQVKVWNNATLTDGVSRTIKHYEIGSTNQTAGFQDILINRDWIFGTGETLTNLNVGLEIVVAGNDLDFSKITIDYIELSNEEIETLKRLSTPVPTD